MPGEEPIRILIVDDEEGMRRGAERALRGHSSELPDLDCIATYAVDAVESAEQAVERLDGDARPDIILLDHKLPGMSGIELMESEAERLQGIMVIMISAYANIETAVRATRQGAYDFLPKPFTPAELRYVVEKAAGRLLLARRAERLAAEKRRVRFEFVRVLGHELKAPLNAVDGYLDILANRTLGDDLSAYTKPIARSQDRLEGMRRLIADLLDMTRVESGEKPRALERLNLRALAVDCLENHRAQADAAGLALELAAPDELPFTGDRTELEMIFNNLVSNAVKYNRPDGRVDVRLEPVADGVRIAVADTGIGMSEEDRGKLFQEFSRIRNHKTAGVLGTGLGLSILRRLVDLYQGAIEVESEPDVGSTFTVELHEPAAT